MMDTLLIWNTYNAEFPPKNIVVVANVEGSNDGEWWRLEGVTALHVMNKTKTQNAERVYGMGDADERFKRDEIESRRHCLHASVVQRIRKAGMGVAVRRSDWIPYSARPWQKLVPWPSLDRPDC